jgi:hypothetical protein
MGTITRLDRQEFLEEYWPGLYSAGQHVLILGPTQRAGKTHLSMQLMEASTNSVRKVLLCMKPRDKTVAGWTQRLGFKEVPTWPPHKRFWEAEPNGYTVWPKFTFDPDRDNEHLREVFRSTILDCYQQGNSLINLDEIYGLCVELNLQKEIIAVLTRGAGMGCGAICCSQRPSGTQQGSIPGPVLSQPYHTFLANESDARQRQRYGEISGGFDPDFINATTLSLPRYHFLYLNADGQSAIIGS